jgi:hypothetical protein
MLGYAYTAVPDREGPPGRRSFCVDDVGVICQTMDGSDPAVIDAKCVPCEQAFERSSVWTFPKLED